MGSGPEHENGNLLLGALNGVKPAKRGQGTTTNQKFQRRVIDYAIDPAKGRAPLLAWFAAEEAGGLWDNEQCPASHHELYSEAAYTALVLGRNRKHKDVEQAAARWIMRSEACACAGETPDGAVILPGQRTFDPRWTSSYRDEEHQAIRKLDGGLKGRKWPKFRDQIGPCIARKLSSEGYDFGGAATLTPETCGPCLPHLVHKMTVERFEHGHIGRMEDPWPAPDDCTVAWAHSSGDRGFNVEPPSELDFGALVVKLETP